MIKSVMSAIKTKLFRLGVRNGSFMVVPTAARTPDRYGVKDYIGTLTPAALAFLKEQEIEHHISEGCGDLFVIYFDKPSDMIKFVFEFGTDWTPPKPSYQTVTFRIQKWETTHLHSRKYRDIKK